MRILSFYILLPLAMLLAACASSSKPRLPVKPDNPPKPLIRPGEKVTAADKGEQAVEGPYHSAYHTENPYLDGRNLILDGKLQEAVDMFTQDIYELDHPNRAALWVFICKCRLGDSEDAMTFLKEFVVPLNLNPQEGDVVTVMIMYYLGGLTDRELMRHFTNWDDLNNCAAYYYYGAYKKYYEKDYVTGNDYIARSVRTRIFDYNEYKFSETEIIGFTARDISQYKDFPIVVAPHTEAGFLDPLFEDEYFSTEDREAMAGADLLTTLDAFSEVEVNLKEEMKKPLITLVPENVGEDQYVIPSMERSGWEIVGKRELLATFKEEAIAIIDNLMIETPYFYLDDQDPIHFYPLTNRFNTYAISFEEYLENSKYFNEKYGMEFSIVSLYLSKGDFLSGVKIPCRMYNYFTDLYGDEVFVTMNLLFTVNDDRTVEMVNKYSKVF